MNRTLPAVAIFAIGALLAATGCGGGDGSGGSAYGSGGSSGSSEAAPGGDGVVAVSKSSDLGPILVDSKGFTLYDFHKDKGGQSSCYGTCAGTWPPLTTSGAPSARSGAEQSKLGTTKRTDGTMQVTYAGHPLYTYVADTKPGDTKGHDFSEFGAQWYALQPRGAEAPD